MTTNTGGPAFPCETLGIDEHGEYRKPFEGMTLRDYLAAKAMQSFLMRVREGSIHDFQREIVAQNAYEIADAMLKAREA